MPPDILLTGNGRSGSNRLLDLLDQSPATVCRNEANAIPGGAFNGIGGTLFAEDLTAERLAQLQRALAGARDRRSFRDRSEQTDKLHYRPRMLARGGQWMVSKKRLRETLPRLHLLEDAREWRSPALYTSRARQAEATLVVKLNACPAWTVALHNAQPELKVVHNLRKPLDYLNSWFNRHVARVEPGSFATTFADVPRILAAFGRDDAGRLADLGEESLIEIEMWRWRFVNETIQTALAGSPRLMTVTYDEIDRDTAAAAERLYAFAGLPLSNETRAAAAAMENKLFARKHTTRLDRERALRIIETVLGDSPLRAIVPLA